MRIERQRRRDTAIKGIESDAETNGRGSGSNGDPCLSLGAHANSARFCNCVTRGERKNTCSRPQRNALKLCMPKMQRTHYCQVFIADCIST